MVFLSLYYLYCYLCFIVIDGLLLCLLSFALINLTLAVLMNAIYSSLDVTGVIQSYGVINR